MENSPEVNDLVITGKPDIDEHLSKVDVLHHADDSSGTTYAVFQQKPDSVAETSEDNSVKNKIKLGLIKFQSILRRMSTCNLVQFWAPVTIDGRRYLTTSEHPFSIYDVTNKRACSFRKHCMGSLFTVDLGDDNVGLADGPPCRVFLKGVAESNLVSNYSVQEHPFKDYALTCEAEVTVFWPVYESQGDQCIGVVEFVEFGKSIHDVEDVSLDMSVAFQAANLRLKEVPCSFSEADHTLDVQLDKGKKRGKKEKFTLDVLEQHAVGRLSDLARHLQVSTSTIKRLLREYEIDDWRHLKKEMKNRMLRSNSLEAVKEHIKERGCTIGDEGSSSGPVLSEAKRARIQNNNSVTIKASFGGDMIRIECSQLAKIDDLLEKIAERFSLQVNSFKIKYEDEDGDIVLLETDEDLSYCFTNVKSFRNCIVYVTVCVK